MTASGIPVRFTRKGDALYALLLDTPRDVEVRIRELRAGAGGEVRLLGSDERLSFRQSGDDLVVRLPARLPDQPVHAIRMSVPT